MILGVIQRILSHLSPEHLKDLFLVVQIALAGAVLAVVYLMTQGRSQSQFRVRESDQKKTSKGRVDLASAKMKRNEPLLLAGIRLDGEPHQILGVGANASVSEIQRAYRDLMKRYHPDIVGRPGTREWEDAQKIAEAINQARNHLLEAHSQSPKRSGR